MLSPSSLLLQLGLTQTSNGVPKVYLHVLVFNADIALFDQRMVQLSQNALNN
jgi:hypothetical protein